MTWKELKDCVEMLQISDIDNYEVDVFGEYSLGSFGSIKELRGMIENTPEGMYKELRLSISA
jgi:hypothetical protein